MFIFRFANLTLSTSCKLFFGAEVKSLELYLQEDKQDLQIFSEFGNSFNQTTILIQKRLQNPMSEYIRTKTVVDLENHIKVVHNFIRGIVKKRLSEDIENKNDLLSRHIKRLRAENQEINETDLLYISTNFLLAGNYQNFDLF